MRWADLNFVMRLVTVLVLTILLVAYGCTMPVQFFGRYDCRTGASQEQQGVDLVERLFGEAAKQRVEDDSDGTVED